MLNQSPDHPQKDQLIAFGLGKLEPTEITQIEKHLESCPDCCETILDLQDDTFVALVRQAPPPATEPSQPDATLDSGLVVAPNQTASVALPPELRVHARYEILGLIGRGGMGDVYKAQHKLMNRPVALKVIKHELVQNEAAVQRFHREVQAAARLHHGNIVTAHDAEQAGNLHFLVMEFVDGVNLDQVIRQQGPLPVDKACDYIRQAAAGLQHAHELRMVHRDIKPHNLMLTTSGEIKILDFGLASFASELAAGEIDESSEMSASDSATHQLTQFGTMMGTPDFMAPEQARDAHAADIRADIYSLGCTFYTLLAGRAPFGEKTVVDKIKAHSDETAQPLSNFRDDVPADVEAILLKMLAKDPGERYQTPAEIASALANRKPVVEPQTLAKPNRARVRRPTLIATACLLLAAVFATVFYIQTNTGLVRVEVADASLEVKLNGQTIEMKDGETPLSIRAGDHKLVVQRGDFKFETDSFQLRRGEEVVLKVDMLQGEVVVLKDGQRFGSAVDERAVPSKEDRLELVAEMAGHTNVVRAVSFLPGNERLVSVDGNGNVIVWDAKTKRIMRRFKVNGETFTDADISADGRLLAIGSDWGTTKGRIDIWDIAKGAPLHQVTHKLDYIEQMRFSPDDSQLMAVGSPPVAVLWDVVKGTETRTIESGFTAKEVKAAAFTPDGTAVALACTGRVKLFDLGTGKAKHEVVLEHNRAINELGFLPSRSSLAAFQGGGWVSLIDTKSWTYDQTLHTAISGRMLRTGAAVNEELLITGSDQGDLQLRNMDGTVRATAKCGIGGCLNISVSSDARHAVTGGGWYFDGAKRKWTVTSDFKLRLWRLPESIRSQPTSHSPIDLLARIDPSQHALDPGISKLNGILYTPRRKENAVVMIPYRPEPREEYDIRLVAEKTDSEGNGLNLGLVIGGRQAHLAMGGGGKKAAWCVERIDGKSMHDGNITCVEGLPWPLNQKVSVLMQVRQDGVRVLRNGKEIINWQGRPEQLSLWDRIVLPDRQSLFFFSQAEFAIHELTLIPAGSTTSDELTGESIPDWTPLLNGRDLAGWKMQPNKPGNWRLEDGVLIGGKLDDGSEEENSFLATDKDDFSDFHLRLEAKLNPGAADTGVLFDFTGGRWAEANISFDPGKRDQYVGSIMVAGTKPDGKTWQAAPTDLASPGQWFTLEVIAVGRQITTRVNGKVAAVHTQRNKTKGPIRLQDRGPFTVAEFRKIEIIELDEQGKPLHRQTSPKVAPLTIGMNDEFGMLFEGRLVAPAELSRRLREAIKENPDRVVAIDLPQRPWTVAGHVDQLEQIARITGAKWITRPAWSQIRIVFGVVNGSAQYIDIEGPGYSATGFVKAHLPNIREVIKKNPNLPVLLDVKEDVDVADPKIAEGFDEVRRIAEEAGAKVRVERERPATENSPSSSVKRESAAIAFERKFTGHTGSVKSVAYSPDGKYIASASGFPKGDGTIRLWDAKSGEEVRQFKGQQGPTQSVCFSHDGEWLLAGGGDKKVRLWDVASGELIKTLEGHEGSIECVGFSPDDKIAVSGSVATGGTDHTARSWDLATGKEIARFTGHKLHVHGVAVIDETRAISVDRMGVGYIWRIDNGQLLKRLSVPSTASNSAYALALSPDRKRAIIGYQDNAIRLWDVTSGEVVQTFVTKNSPVMSVCMSADQRHVFAGGGATGDTKIAVEMFDVASGKRVAATEPMEGTTWSIALAPDGRHVVSAGGATWNPEEAFVANGDNDLHLWKLPKEVWPTNANIESVQPRGAPTVEAPAR